MAGGFVEVMPGSWIGYAGDADGHLRAIARRNKLSGAWAKAEAVLEAMERARDREVWADYEPCHIDRKA